MLVSCSHYIIHFKYTLNFNLKLSVVSLKSFVAHCITGKVGTHLGKTTCHSWFLLEHISPPFPELGNLSLRDGIIASHVISSDVETLPTSNKDDIFMYVYVCVCIDIYTLPAESPATPPFPLESVRESRLCCFSACSTHDVGFF